MLESLNNINFKRFCLKSYPLFLDGNLATNKHFLIDTDWLDSIKSKKIVGLKKRITKARLKSVKSQLLGELVERKNLVAFLACHKITPAHKKLDLTKAKTLLGYTTRDRHKVPTRVEYCLDSSFERLEFYCFDLEYSILFYLEPDLEVFVSSPSEPAIVQKNKKTVALLMPIKNHSHK